MENRIGVHMAALVNDCSQSKLDRSVKRSRSDVDFSATFTFYVPCVVQRVRAIGSRRGLDGNDRLGKLIVKQVSIDHTEDFFKASGKARGLNDFFPVSVSFLKFIVDEKERDRL